MEAEPQAVPDGSGTGNTNNRPHPSKCWCFTLNNYEENSRGAIISKLSKRDKYIIGNEIGEKGTPHLQGYIHFTRKVRPKNMFDQKIHWEKARGNDDQNYDYCSKGGDFMQNMKKILHDPLKGKKLYDFQKEIIQIIREKPDDRTVHWYWDKKGGCGKTALVKHICMNQKALMVGGKANDIKFAISKWFENDPDLNVVFFNLVRSVEDYVSYDAIESVKDGIFFSGKYESNQTIFDSPHCIVFANFKPDENKLSKDRWRVVEIDRSADTLYGNRTVVGSLESYLLDTGD